ncbi:TPA: hypothetical protein N0F65_000036 [Lagenidium giganteum]|uniref:LRAT domain-containing protein n=1 Tax=Lagenidium giganteum TaxID=4803 RepID=A0AAV2YQL0_9STRA|nr:TPA: hypothetical protein N0F65_000036 [Lagenidium giganteum]
MNTCVVRDVSTLQLADHICIWDKTRWPFRYTHHGIVYSMGKTADDVVIAHVWSRIDGFRESQADSSFRLTSLTEFLNNRPLADMRRVQYNSSLLGDAFSQLGEVHRSKCDIPPVVLARCAFLLGKGKGHFSILSLNCEHVALWCKSGVVWCKQLFYKVQAKAPFASAKPSSLQCLAKLETTLAQLRQECLVKNQALAALDGKPVYLQLGEAKFVKRLGDALYAVHNDPKESDLAFRHAPTPFVVRVDLVAYNCVKVMLQDAHTGEYVCSKAKCVKMLRRRPYHRENLFKFEYAWNGELQSRRHRRWYLGAQTRDGLLRTFNTRDRASTFTIVDAALIDSESVAIDFKALEINDTTSEEEKAQRLDSERDVDTEDEHDELLEAELEASTSYHAPHTIAA